MPKVEPEVPKDSEKDLVEAFRYLKKCQKQAETVLVELKALAEQTKGVRARYNAALELAGEAMAKIEKIITPTAEPAS